MNCPHCQFLLPKDFLPEEPLNGLLHCPACPGNMIFYASRSEGIFFSQARLNYQNNIYMINYHFRTNLLDIFVGNDVWHDRKIAQLALPIPQSDDYIKILQSVIDNKALL